MAKKQKPMRADEFMRQLESDPEWVAKRDQREREREKYGQILDADQKQLVLEICRVGYKIESVWDLVNNTPHKFLERRFLGEYPDAYPILVKHLSIDHHPRIREGIIRALTVSDGGDAVAWALLCEFESEQNAEMKWVIANALRTVMNRNARKRYPAIDAFYLTHGREDRSENAG